MKEKKKTQERRSRRRTLGPAKAAIIFDFDGTIANTVVAFARVFEHLTKQPVPLTTAEIEHLKSLSGIEFMEFFKLPKWKVPYLIFRGKKMLREHMDGIQIYPGMTEVIQTLHRLNIPLYIVSSNNTETIQGYLQENNLGEYFIAVSGGASPFAKARKLLRLLDAHNIDLESSWYVGDETRDIIAAHHVGIKIASVSWGFNSRESLSAKQPDVLVDTSTELLATLRKAFKD